jgi:hypothetical protein
VNKNNHTNPTLFHTIGNASGILSIYFPKEMSPYISLMFLVFNIGMLGIMGKTAVMTGHTWGGALC